MAEYLWTSNPGYKLIFIVSSIDYFWFYRRQIYVGSVQVVKFLLILQHTYVIYTCIWPGSLNLWSYFLLLLVCSAVQWVTLSISDLCCRSATPDCQENFFSHTCHSTRRPLNKASFDSVKVSAKPFFFTKLLIVLSVFDMLDNFWKLFLTDIANTLSWRLVGGL